MNELQSPAETSIYRVSNSCNIKDVICEDMYLFVRFRHATDICKKLISVFLPMLCFYDSIVL